MGWFERWALRVVASFDTPMRAKDGQTDASGWLIGEREALADLYRFR